MLTPKELHELLECDPEAGMLTWRERTPDLFTGSYRTAAGNCASWNGRYSGEPAFTSCDGSGYRVGGIFNRLYYAHRVIWAMVHGEWPKGQIDHINGIRVDNRIENLRSVTNQENGRNQKMYSTNKSGHVGVHWHKSARKWRARIKVDGVDISLGCFIDIEDAIAARAAADIKYGFHENHGRVVT